MSIIAKDVTNVSRSVLCDSTGRLLVVDSGGGGGGAVTITPASTPIVQNSITTIAGSSQVTLLTYTNATGALLQVGSVIATGSVDAEYELQLNATKFLVLRSSEQDRNAAAHFGFGLRLEIGNILTVKVTHYDTFVADFDCSLFLFKW